MTYGLHDALQHADVLLANRDQQRQRGPDIQRAGEHSAPGHGNRQIFRGIFNFIAHHGGQFQADQPEADYAEGI